ncbi:morn repeat incomplete domain containing protein [Pandoravirus celtis]|uniref:Morn repeat incomplete domain containing protein n=1 Tax=Pandoravirus celtis TaxID=2568002 RepID=A0A4D6EHL0_9VIRU|nr:morn repeat incomplete domain containing protein [Pandoravirus celtis]
MCTANSTNAPLCPQDGSPFDDLPVEVALHVLKFFAKDDVAKDVVALLHWSATCKRHRQLAMDASVWRHLCERHFGPPLHLQFLAMGKDWLWLYRAQACPVDVSKGPPGPWVGAKSLANMYRGAMVYWGDLFNGRPDGYGLMLNMPGKRYLEPARTSDDAGVQPTSRYEGHWKAGKMHGYGIKVDFDGDVYDGDWEAGKKNGYGRYVWADDKSIYEGEWKRDQRHGHGTMTYVDGRQYKGQWHEDQTHGYGGCVWPDGAIYRGGWKKGWRHGCGSMFYRDGARYDGHWRKSKCHGYGEWVSAAGDPHRRGLYYRIDRHLSILAVADDTVYNNPDNDQHPPSEDRQASVGSAAGSGGSSYYGWWVDGVMSGHGVCRWPNGLEYVGMFENDAIGGHGVYAYPDGTRVAATWDGPNIVHAVATRPDGFRYDGLWHKTRGSTGRGSCLYPDGSRIVGTWDGNKAIDGEIVTHRTVGPPCDSTAPCMACSVMA